MDIAIGPNLFGCVKDQMSLIAVCEKYKASPGEWINDFS